MTTKLTFSGYGTVTYHVAEAGYLKGYTLAQVSSDKLADALDRHQDNGRALDRAKRWVGEIYECSPTCDVGFEIVDRRGDPIRHA